MPSMYTFYVFASIISVFLFIHLLFHFIYCYQSSIAFSSLLINGLYDVYVTIISNPPPFPFPEWKILVVNIINRGFPRFIILTD